MRKHFFILMVFCFSANAADYEYQRVKHPTYSIGQHDEVGQPYESSQSPKVCERYLDNLNYFSRHNIANSCGQSVAPTLTQYIRPVEWENLDPDKYPILFKDLVHGYYEPYKHEEPTKAELTARSAEVRQGQFVFRRAKLDLKGFPDGGPPLWRWNQSKSAVVSRTAETKFNIVQYGRNIVDDGRSATSWGCKPKTGRILSTDALPLLSMVLASEDLQTEYEELGPIYPEGARTTFNLWFINNHVYGESYDKRGEVQLQELRTDLPVHMEPVCLYRLHRK